MGKVDESLGTCTVCRSKVSTTDTINKLHDDYLDKMTETIKGQFDIYSKKFNERINELQKSVEFLSNKVDDYEVKITGYENTVKTLEESNESLTKDNRVLKQEVSSLKFQIESLEQYNRNKNLEIDGVPNNEGEDIRDVVSTLSELVGVPIDYKMDIQAAHRVPTKRKSGVKPIIVQFSNRQKRDLFLKKSKSVKIKSTHFNPHVPETTVYVNQHLTPYNRELLFKAKDLKTIGYAFVWPHDGKVLVKRSAGPGDKAVQVTCASDVENLKKQIQAKQK